MFPVSNLSLNISTFLPFDCFKEFFYLSEEAFLVLYNVYEDMSSTIWKTYILGFELLDEDKLVITVKVNHLKGTSKEGLTNVNQR